MDKQYIPSTLENMVKNFSADVFTGEDTNCKPEKDEGRRVVLDLIKDMKGHSVTCVNFFYFPRTGN